MAKCGGQQWGRSCVLSALIYSISCLAEPHHSLVRVGGLTLVIASMQAGNGEHSLSLSKATLFARKPCPPSHKQIAPWAAGRHWSMSCGQAGSEQPVSLVDNALTETSKDTFKMVKATSSVCICVYLRLLQAKTHWSTLRAPDSRKPLRLALFTCALQALECTRLHWYRLFFHCFGN